MRGFFQYKFCAYVAIFTFTMRSTFTFFTFQNRKKASKSGILEILPSWYILSLKPTGKGDCKNLIHISSVSCLFLLFNQVDEFGSYIVFSTKPCVVGTQMGTQNTYFNQ